MDPAKIKRWHRLRDQVLQNQGWPRGLWFTALEDGLQAALGDGAPLLADFRRDRAELLRLEQRASGSYHDGLRIGQLETQILQLVDRADRTLTNGAAGPAEPRPAAAEPVAPPAAPPVAAPAVADPRPRRQGWHAAAVALAAGGLMGALGAAGASLYYELRSAAQDAQQMARIDRLLAERAASLRAELERRLSTPGEDQSGPAGPLHGRSVALGRALDQLSLDVSALGMRLPALDQELERITAGAGQMSDDLARAGSQIDALEAATPELTAWLAQQKGALEQGVQSGRDALGGITARVQQLAGEVDRSRGLLVELNQSLVEGLEQARVDGNALRTAVDEMRVTGLEVAKLMEGAEDKVEAAHAAMQAKIDQMLSDLSEQADLAVLRAGDVGRRAEGEVVRRVDVAGAAALDAVAQERAAKLAALAEQVAASQRELEQTRAGLLESWQRLDQSVAQRQSEVLTSLDGYAGTIGVRVEELLQALDVMVAGAGG